MDTSSVQAYRDLVSWTLSGTYDEDRPVLIDADRPNERYVTRKTAGELVNALTGAFPEGETTLLHLPNDVCLVHDPEASSD